MSKAKPKQPKGGHGLPFDPTFDYHSWLRPEEQRYTSVPTHTDTNLATNRDAYPPSAPELATRNVKDDEFTLEIEETGEQNQENTGELQTTVAEDTQFDLEPETADQGFPYQELVLNGSHIPNLDLGPSAHSDPSVLTTYGSLSQFHNHD